MLYISGYGPEDEVIGKPFYTGILKENIRLEQGYNTTRICGVILLRALEDYLGCIDKIDYIVKAFRLISSAVEQEPKDLGENKKVVLCIAAPTGNF